MKWSLIRIYKIIFIVSHSRPFMTLVKISSKDIKNLRASLNSSLFSYSMIFWCPSVRRNQRPSIHTKVWNRWEERRVSWTCACKQTGGSLLKNTCCWSVRAQSVRSSSPGKVEDKINGSMVRNTDFM